MDYEFSWVRLLMCGMFSYFWFSFGDVRWLFYPYVEFYNVPTMDSSERPKPLIGMRENLVRDHWKDLFCLMDARSLPFCTLLYNSDSIFGVRWF